eukprot:TRINITY_DN1745_c0_g2_i4.p1 TRINITY_DN1745_c0_g2~~TRINITY_DN1745_c0_g2_i4.p1  ORF type:complete len:128 (+),score=13.71 TRINITY_DN1745_c0_g2_i4:27-410(+)
MEKGIKRTIKKKLFSRRTWTVEQKLKILSEVSIGENGRGIRAISRKYGLTAVQLRKWQNREKIEPYVIFKRKKIPKNKLGGDRFPKAISVSPAPKGWMNKELMKHWVTNVFNKRMGGIWRPQSLLVL